MKLKVVIEAGEQSGYVVHVPALPGCWSQGSTREEALTNVREAVEGWIEAQQDRADRAEPSALFDLITV